LSIGEPFQGSIVPVNCNPGFSFLEPWAEISQRLRRISTLTSNYRRRLDAYHEAIRKVTELLTWPCSTSLRTQVPEAIPVDSMKFTCFTLRPEDRAQLIRNTTSAGAVSW